MDEEFDTSVDTSDVDTSADIDSSDVVDDMPEDIPDDIPEDIPEEEPEMMGEDDLSDDIPEDAPEEEPEMMEEDDLSDDIPEDILEEEPEMMEEDDLSDDIPEDVPKEEPEMMEEDDLSDDIPEDVADDEPESIDDDLSEDIPEDIPEEEPEMMEEDDLSDDIPEDIPEEEPEMMEEDDLSDDIPENIPEDESELTEDDSKSDMSEDKDEYTADSDEAETEDIAKETTYEMEDTDSAEQTEYTQDDPYITEEGDMPDNIPEDMPNNEPETNGKGDVTETISNNDSTTNDDKTGAVPLNVSNENLSEGANKVKTFSSVGDNPSSSDDGDISSPPSSPNDTKVRKRDEFELLKSGNDAINRRLEAQSDDYREKGLSEDEIQDRIAADRWNFQKEFLEDAFPGQDVSPNVFNGFSENGAKDRIADIENSDTLINQLENIEINDVHDTGELSDKFNDDEHQSFPLNQLENKEMDYDELGANSFADQETLSRGEVPDNIFNDKDVEDMVDIENLKLEDLSKNDYEKLKQADPQKASQLLTDYNDRKIKPDDLSSLSRHLSVDNNDGLYVVDESLSKDRATMRDISTGQEYLVYPNPMDRVSHMDGRQGQNDLGMYQDCGIASTAKSINDVYGKSVTSENRLVNYAYDTGNCCIERNADGTVDMFNSGGTWEGNVKDFYNANGLDTDMYVGNYVPTPEFLAERLKNGEVATLAVNHDLMWSWDEAQAFDPNVVDESRYISDSRYAARVDDLMKMKDGGTFKADHFVNVSNAVYDKDGSLTHFIVSDTGNGTTKMIDKDYLYRAYYGSDNINVSAQGCVIAGRRRI